MRCALACLAALALLLVAPSMAHAAGIAASTARVPLERDLNRSNAVIKAGPSDGPSASAPGVFLQRDPSGYKDSVNLYAAFANDPVNNRDPTGREQKSVISQYADDVNTMCLGVARGFGAPNIEAPTDPQLADMFYKGQLVGSLAGLCVDALGFSAGSAASGGGAALCLTGAGCVVGGPAVVAGTSMVVASAGAAGALHTPRAVEALNNILSQGGKAPPKAPNEPPNPPSTTPQTSTPPESPPTAPGSVVQLSPQQQKAIRSLEKQIAKHEAKLARFRSNPTVRPGMENLPQEVIEAQQQTRIQHLETEIQTFKENIAKILRGEQ